MIILEGVDGVGKTALAKEICSQSGMDYMHESNSDEGFARYVRLSNLGNTHQVYDRFHLGELVYPTVKMDGRTPLNRAQLYMVDQALRACGSILIHCTSSMKFIQKSFIKKGETFITLDQARKVKELYKTVAGYSLLPTLTYDPEHHNIKEFAAMALNVYKRQPRFAWKMGAMGSQSLGATMLVGDKLNPFTVLPDAENPRLAFNWHTGCSLFLHSALLVSGRRDYYITNAIKYNIPEVDVKKLELEIATIKPARIIALGNTPAEILQSMGVQFEKTFHPSYWSRFKSKEIHKFIDFLSGSHAVQPQSV